MKGKKSSADQYVLVLVALLVTLSMIACSEDKDKDKDTGDANRPEQILRPTVIYGDDDRLDLFQVSDPALLAMADATVALINKINIGNKSDQTKTIDVNNFGKSYNLCQDEPFREQNTAAFCSGFLVADDIIVTAGHCIRYSSQCETTRFVFGFGIKQQGGIGPNEVPASEVYSCAEIVSSGVENNGLDYSIIKLDRKVANHTPLRIRRTGAPGVGEPLVVIGHPVGLPTKVAGGARVRELKDAYLVANLDTYGGNSGSAVFNATSGEVEGILVRGEADFVSRGSCRVSNQCSDASCRGEDVTRITSIADLIPEQTVIEEPETELGELHALSEPSIAIPDNQSTGVVDTLEVDEAPQGRRVLVEVDIEHSWKGDLVVTLVSPGGHQWRLHSRSGGYQNDISGVYGLDLEAKDSLQAASLIEEPGAWSLKVSDHARRDVGTLRQWALHFVK